MPRSIERKRGGVLRYRTLSIGKGKYLHVAVVRRRGPRGGHTVAGEVHKIRVLRSRVIGGDYKPAKVYHRVRGPRTNLIFYVPGKGKARQRARQRRGRSPFDAGRTFSDGF